jgi:hypothetical protein
MSNDRSDIDRRRAHRARAAEQHRITSIRIRPGHDARVIDASAAGALLETTHRLLPGRAVELQMQTQTEQVSVRARVVRCAVVQVRAATVFYRGAVVFDRHLPWFAGSGEHAVPDAEHRAGFQQRADPTHVA